MSIHVFGANFKLTDAIIRHARVRVEASLRAAHDRMDYVLVRLGDINADRGGVDKSCRIVARFDAAGPVVAEAVDRDLYAAIDQAAARLRSAVLKRLSRRRTLRREHAHRLPAGPRWGHSVAGAM